MNKVASLEFEPFLYKSPDKHLSEAVGTSDSDKFGSYDRRKHSTSENSSDKPTEFVSRNYSTVEEEKIDNNLANFGGNLEDSKLSRSSDNRGSKKMVQHVPKRVRKRKNFADNSGIRNSDVTIDASEEAEEEEPSTFRVDRNNNVYRNALIEDDSEDAKSIDINLLP